MGSESSTRKRLRGVVLAYDPDAQVVQVENAVNSGDPDTYICTRGRSVWVELKYVALPKRVSTPIRCRHVRTAQLMWAADHLKAGGRVWFLVQVGNWYFLLLPRIAARLLNGVKREDLHNWATKVYKGALPAQVMQDMLEQPCTC